KAKLAERPQSIAFGAVGKMQLSTRLDENIHAIETLAGAAPDLVVRRMVVFEGTRAAVVFYDTLGRSDLVSIEVIKPLAYGAGQVESPPRTLSALESFIRES